MPNNPKAIEERMNRMINAWQTLAPTKTFAGMTLTDFKAVCAPGQAARQHIADLENQLAQAINDRDAADADFLEKAQLIINSILGDPTEGPDSSLIEAMGRVRKSERATGLTKKSKAAGGHDSGTPK